MLTRMDVPENKARKDGTNSPALGWAKRLQAIAQTGLTYAKDQYDIERYRSVRQIAAEILAASFSNPISAAEGIAAVWVNGVLSYQDGAAAQERAGRFLPRTSLGLS